MKEMNDQCVIDEVEFNKRLSRYEDLIDEIKYSLEIRLKESDIKVSSIQGRKKSYESFKEKISRKSYLNPFEEITDFAGVRVVCHYENDAEQISEIIRNEFNVEDLIDKSEMLGVDKMGYGGTHFIATLGARYSGARYDGLEKLKCEIQVRTVLQDAWAMISHQLSYKNEESVPPRLQRDLNNVAALLEIAQRTFDNVRHQRNSYVQEIHEKEENHVEFLAQPVDYETLLAYTKWKFPSLPVSDVLNIRLLQDLNVEDYPTLSKIDWAVEHAKVAVEKYVEDNPEWFKFGTDYLTKSLGFVDDKFLARHGFARKTREAIERYRHLIQ